MKAEYYITENDKNPEADGFSENILLSGGELLNACAFLPTGFFETHQS